LRNKLIVLAAIFGLLAASGVAYADTDDDNGQEPDTTFNFGYDEENGVFVWGASDSDGLYDCTLEGGFFGTYTRVDEGYLLVEDLQDEEEGDPVEHEVNEDHEDSDGAEPVAYPGPDEECAVSGDLVAGPEGQINHGMFLRLFNLMYDGPARGCLVRHIAQSDLGKVESDQQVNVSDVDPDAETEDPESGTIEFETVMTECNHGPAVLAESDDESGPAAQAGRPAHTGPPDHAGKPADVGSQGNGRGNSDSAPGRNP
jgi:hypothetical protein